MNSMLVAVVAAMMSALVAVVWAAAKLKSDASCLQLWQSVRQFHSQAVATTPEPSASREVNRVALVFAHPDDESMFFLPLVHSLQRHNKDHNRAGKQWEFSLLCLSRGNADGLGDVRDQELRRVAQFLGVASDQVEILEDPKLQDGMRQHWDPEYVASIVKDFVRRRDIHAVSVQRCSMCGFINNLKLTRSDLMQIFTFDDRGVSDHANHKAVSRGVRVAHAHSLQEQQRAFGLFLLQSTSVVRKYLGVLDVFLSLSNDWLMLCFDPQWNWQAMALHASQFVWYRRLFVGFSRYTFVNTFDQIR